MKCLKPFLKQEQMEDEDSHVGSPSPPYEGIITEEAEKQLESKGGDFSVNGMNEHDEVNIIISFH